MRLDLEDADCVAAMILEVAKRCKDDKNTHGKGPWVGRCLDLTKAYKQMCVSERDADVSVIFFLGKDCQPQYYISHSLLFGCTASVYSFNRVTKALSFLLCKMLSIPSSVYYDDFPLFSPESSSASATWAATALLDLGWDHARVGEDSKGIPFASSFDVLGMTVQLHRVPSGEVTLQNKEGRLDQLVDLFEGFRTRKAVTVHEAQVAHGLLNFSAGFVNGRALRLTCQELMRITKSSRPASGSSVCEFCSRCVETLRSLVPRVLKVGTPLRPVHIFTDGAWEGGRAGIGAVVFDTSSSQSWAMAGTVPRELVLKWEEEVGTQIICQIELYAMVCLRWYLGCALDGRRVLWWVDNESARYGLIKGISDSMTMCDLIQAFAIEDSRAPSYSWYERVPSFSNIADGPSRGSQAYPVYKDLLARLGLAG
eukprot:s8486_g3.t1